MKAWRDFLKAQEKRFGKETTKKWLHSLKIIKFDACNLYLEAENAFHLNWFEEHIRPLIKNKFFNNNHHLVKVHILTQHRENKFKKRQNESYPQENSISELSTFDLFVPLDKNLMAYKLLREIVMTACNFNPIFIYGPSGTGKSHLLMATYHLIKNSGKKALFINAKTFTEQVVNAIRLGTLNKFRQAYRFLDILLIDDIQVFSKKNATQEEFFHTFNSLHSQNCQIILTANNAPSQLSQIEPRLVSRFEWGIVLPLKKLEKKDIKKVLINKIKSLKISIKEDIINFIVNNFPDNIKLAIKALETLLIRCDLNKDVNLKEILSDLIEEEEKTKTTPTKVVKIVSDHFGIRPEDILSKSQTKECCYPRQVAMYFCRKNLNMNLIDIAKFFSRDHSTVISGIKQITQKINRETATLPLILELSNLL